MTIVWIRLIVAGIASLAWGIVLWRRASDRYSERTGERWGPPSAPAYFLALGGVMAAGIGAVLLAVG